MLNNFSEFNRQMMHIICGVVIVLLIKIGYLGLIGLGVIIVVGFMISMIYRKIEIPGIRWFLLRFEREKNMKTFPGKGALFYMLGCFFAVLFFRQEVALAAIMIMALGDSISTLFSKRYQGKIKHPFSNRKYLEGALVGGFAGFLGAMLFINPIIAFLASFISMILEGIDIKFGFQQVDDNLILPIVAGLLISLLELII